VIQALLGYVLVRLLRIEVGRLLAAGMLSCEVPVRQDNKSKPQKDVTRRDSAISLNGP